MSYMSGIKVKDTRKGLHDTYIKLYRIASEVIIISERGKPSTKKRRKSSASSTSTPWLGLPVAVELKDGRYLVGTLEQLNSQNVTIKSIESKVNQQIVKKKRHTTKKPRSKKAQISGFLGAISAFPFGALTGMQKALNAAAALNGAGKQLQPAAAPSVSGAGAGATAAAVSNDTGSNDGVSMNGYKQPSFLEFLNGVMPHMKIGLDLVKSITPIIGMFKG